MSENGRHPMALPSLSSFFPCSMTGCSLVKSTWQCQWETIHTPMLFTGMEGNDKVIHNYPRSIGKNTNIRSQYEVQKSTKWHFLSYLLVVASCSSLQFLLLSHAANGSNNFVISTSVILYHSQMKARTPSILNVKQQIDFKIC